MKIIIRDENGIEKVLADTDNSLPGFLFCLFLNSDKSRITIDKIQKLVLIKHKQKIKKVRFEDVKEVRVIEKVIDDGLGNTNYVYDIDLIFNGGSERIFKKVNLELAKIAKICKEIGVNGYCIDENKKSTRIFPSEDSISEDSTPGNSQA